MVVSEAVGYNGICVRFCPVDDGRKDSGKIDFTLMLSSGSLSDSGRCYLMWE